MKEITALVSRNRKLFFKDKGMLFSSMITPVILIVLYATFLANVYKDSFVSATSCSKLCNCYILRQSYDGSGQSQRSKKRF